MNTNRKTLLRKQYEVLIQEALPNVYRGYIFIFLFFFPSQKQILCRYPTVYLEIIRYSGGFVGMDRSVRRFWSVVASMNDRERAALLRFVTSCERPPPLGFESMQPPFCLHRVGIRSDEERLPTASTCFNTLKLPTYSSEKVRSTSSLGHSPCLSLCSRFLFHPRSPDSALANVFCECRAGAMSSERPQDASMR